MQTLGLTYRPQAHVSSDGTYTKSPRVDQRDLLKRLAVLAGVRKASSTLVVGWHDSSCVM